MLIKINHCFIAIESFTWCYIISSIYAIYTSPCTNEWENMMWEKCCKKYWNKKNHPIIWFWISSCSSWIWFVSFTFVLRRASFEYVILFILITKQSPVILFRAQKQRTRKIRMAIVWSKWHDMKNDVSPLFSKPNIIFLFFCWF